MGGGRSRGSTIGRCALALDTRDQTLLWRMFHALEVTRQCRPFSQ